MSERVTLHKGNTCMPRYEAEEFDNKDITFVAREPYKPHVELRRLTLPATALPALRRMLGVDADRMAKLEALAEAMRMVKLEHDADEREGTGEPREMCHCELCLAIAALDAPTDGEETK